MNDVQKAFETIWTLYEDTGIDKRTAFDLFALGAEYAAARLKNVVTSLTPPPEPPR